MTRANSAQTKTVEQWAGCYDDGWRDLIVPEAFAHPAKAARGLLVRILDELFVMGALERGDLVLDCFAGVGTTGIEAASRGCRFIGCELEPKFVALARENFEKHAATWAAIGRPQPVMMQGDSRRLREVIGPALAECVVSSPPYVDSLTQGNHPEGYDYTQYGGRGQLAHAQRYGDNTPGQLGAMPAGDVSAVVSSPPYVSGGHHTDQTGAWNTNQRGQGGTRDTAGYGESAGQLARLSEGAMADALVSSPPYESALDDRGRDPILSAERRERWARKNPDRNIQKPIHNYEGSEGNIGHEHGDTFWTAARQIVAESYAILRPGGTAVWIVKSFVRNKQIVDFPGDWRRLCEACGFETVKEVHAMLVAEERKPHLWDGERVTKRERKSFFRRLAEAKGSPAIDYETVWFMVKR